MTAQIRSAEAVVSQTIQREGLLEADDRILVAFSGGADSSALAAVLDDLGYDVILAHVDHRLHPLSSELADNAKEIASGLGIEFHLETVSVDPPTEAEARRVRYMELERIADLTGAAKIATGHTLDDQAETVLMRLGRGGRAVGIPYMRGRIVRPLLDIRRSDTELICRSKKIDFLQDPTNADTRFRRNLIRKRVFPRFTDDVIVHLAQIAGHSRAHVEEAEQRVEEAWRSSVQLETDRIVIERAVLSDPSLGPPLVRAVLVEAGIEGTSRLVADIVSKVVPETGASLQLPGGLSVWCEPDHVVVGRLRRREFPSLPVRLPGRTVVKEWGLKVAAEEVPLGKIEAGDFTAVLDFDLLGGEVFIRSRMSGDRFRPLGMVGEKKLQDFFVDEKVPRYERDAVPLLVCDGEIAWVVGHRIGDRFKLTDETRRAIRIEIIRL